MTTQKQTIHKILIAPDKFKGSLTSTQAAEAIRKGIEERYLLPDSSSPAAPATPAASVAFAAPATPVTSAGNDLGLDYAASDGVMEVGNVPRLEFRIVEIADGGDGSLEVLQKKISGAEIVPIAVHNPLGKEVPSQILLYRSFRAENNRESRLEESLESEKRGMQCAFIEMAKVSGLEMLAKEERNPLYTSTYGMGEAIKSAIGQGAQEITLSIGGSATNDGGAGMLQALGYRFLDAAGEEIPSPICGGDLQRVASIVAPELQGAISDCGPSGNYGVLQQSDSGEFLQGIKFKVICDVTNPLLGPQGATAVYGPQKGADEKALQQLEAGLANYAAVAEKCLDIPQSCKEYPGAGAAGGVGYAGLAFLGAELIPGWRFFAQITSLEESVQWADLVITGEGSLDSQSLSGKVVSGVLKLAAQYDKEVAIFCGVNKLTPDEMNAMESTLPKGVSCYSIASLGYPLEVCMRDAALLLQQLAREQA